MMLFQGMYCFTWTTLHRGITLIPDIVDERLTHWMKEIKIYKDLENKKAS